MDFSTVADTLLEQKIVKSRQAANATQLCVMQWMHGHRFDFEKSQTKTNRARLRKVGIDIKLPYDATIRPIQINSIRPITVEPLHVPDWYEQPQPTRRLTLVA